MDPDRVEFAPYEARWLDELVSLWRTSFEHGVGVVDPNPLSEQRNFFATEVAPKNAVVIAHRGNLLLGFIAASPVSVAQLHVRVGHLRQGIGTRLLDWAKTQSNGSLWLYTFARNWRACAFYEKHGFRVIARGFEPTWQLDDVKYAWTAPER